MNRTWLSLFAATVAVACAPAANAITFKLVTQLDAFNLGTATPGSVAAYGDTVYVSGLFGGEISRIDDPLGTPVNANTFGGGLPGNGRVSLSTDGTTLVGASNNASAADTIQSFAFGADTLNFQNTTAAYPRGRFDGAAVDPISGNIFVTGFGSGFPLILDATTGAEVVGSSPSGLFDGPTGTGFRDIEFDNATGDIYLRAVNGVAVGGRNGVDDFVKLDGTTAGVEAIAFGPTVGDGFNSAINSEFVPNPFGADVVIFNRRNAADTFVDQVLVYEADAVNQQVAATFLAADNSLFTTSNAANGIYDFSWDPVNDLLYVSDSSAGQVYAFTIVPEPTTALLAALGVVAVAARRR